MLHIYSDTNQNRRESNQDRYTAVKFSLKNGESAHLLAVADGMGGMDFGEQYAQAALAAAVACAAETVFLAEQKSLETSRASVNTLLEEGFGGLADSFCERVNRCVVREAEQAGWGAGGATLSACVVIADRLMTFNAGDSPIYLLRGGQAAELGVRDNGGEQYVRENRLERGTHEYYEKASALTQYIGKRNGSLPTHFAKESLAERDIVILGSDGAFGICNCAADLQEAFGRVAASSLCDRLLAESARHTGDNQTAIVIEYFEKTAKGLFSFLKSSLGATS